MAASFGDGLAPSCELKAERQLGEVAPESDTYGSVRRALIEISELSVITLPTTPYADGKAPSYDR